MQCWCVWKANVNVLSQTDVPGCLKTTTKWFPNTTSVLMTGL